MRGRGTRALCLWGAAALLTAAIGVAERPAIDAAPRVARSDSGVLPGHLAAGASGDLYVSYRTDSLVGMVLRTSAEGRPLARWPVARARSGEAPYDLAASGEGGVFVAMSDVGLVRHYAADGQVTVEWAAQGLVGAIASEPRGTTGETDVYVLAAPPDGGTTVRRYDGASGELLASFAVADLARDLTAWPTAGSEAPDVVVSAGPLVEGSQISRYAADGLKVGEWATGLSYGAAGMDVDPRGGYVWINLGPRWVLRAGETQAFERDGALGVRCHLSEMPLDLAIGRNGDLYVLGYRYAYEEAPHRLVRYRPDCTVVDEWDIEDLTGPRLNIPWACR